MRVRAGWSGETPTAWRKADVDCDETDLARLGSEHGFDLARLSNTQAFRLLEAEANLLLLTHVLVRYGAGLPAEYRDDHRKYLQDKAAILAEITAART